MSKSARDLLLTCLLAAAVPACSARSSGSTGPSGGCTPGATEGCACPGGLAGVHFCQTDLTFTACVCSGADAGFDVPSFDVAPGVDVAPHDVATPDVATPDVAPVDAPVDAPATYPPGPYGSAVCRRFQPFRLDVCDGTTWDFAGDDFFSSNATVLLFDAAWSVPSQSQTRQIETALGPYQARGVRVVQVLVQGADRAAITPSSCAAWRSRYGLTIPVLMDPSQTLAAYYPSQAFPAALIVDRNGVIRYRAYGADSGLSSVRAALDVVFNEPGTCTP